jgi:hypothetical protein
MRTRRGLVLASLAGTAALAIGVSGTALASGHSGATCTYRLTNTLTTKTSGTMSGSVRCPKPARKGTAKFAYTLTSSKKTVTYTGTFHDHFPHRGRLAGTFTLSGTKSPNSALTGTFAVTKGTRKLSKAHGGGTLNCTTTNHGATYKCKAVFTAGRL